MEVEKKPTRYAVRRHKKKPAFITNKDGLSFDEKRRIVYIHVQDLLSPAKTTTAANVFRIKASKALPASNLRIIHHKDDPIRKVNKAKEIERTLVCNQALSIIMSYMEQDMLLHKCQTFVNRSSKMRIGVFRHKLPWRTREDLYVGLKGVGDKQRHIALNDIYGQYSNRKGFLNHIDNYEDLRL